jgi:hypothetical protein
MAECGEGWISNTNPRDRHICVRDRHFGVEHTDAKGQRFILLGNSRVRILNPKR